MIEEHAWVHETLGGGTVEVFAARRASCDGCTAEKGCGRAALAGLFAGPARVRVDDPLGVRPGERVIIGLREDALLRASLILYGLPLSGMLLAALLAQWWFASEALVVMSAAVGLVGGIWRGRVWSRRVHDDVRFRPVILRRASARECELHPLPEKGQ